MADYYLFPEQTYNKDGFFGLIPIKYTEFNLFIKNTSGYSLVPIINSSGEVTNLISKGQVRFNLISNLSSNYNLISGVKPLEDLTGNQELQLIQYPEEINNISNYGSSILQIIAYLNSVYPETNYGINNLILYLFLVSVMSSFNVGNWKIKNPPFVNVQIANYVSTNTSKANYRLTHVDRDF